MFLTHSYSGRSLKKMSKVASKGPDKKPCSQYEQCRAGYYEDRVVSYVLAPNNSSDLAQFGGGSTGVDQLGEVGLEWDALAPGGNLSRYEGVGVRLLLLDLPVRVTADVAVSLASKGELEVFDREECQRVIDRDDVVDVELAEGPQLLFKRCKREC